MLALTVCEQWRIQECAPGGSVSDPEIISGEIMGRGSWEVESEGVIRGIFLTIDMLVHEF